MIEATVKSVFDDLGIEPRLHQAEVCVAILRDFLERGKRCVFVDAPTGSGKSVIAVVVSRAMDRMLSPDGCKSVIVSSTNALIRQYERDFARASEIVTVFGAERYPCALRTEMSHKPINADKCYRRSPFWAKKAEGTDLASRCDDCGFKRSRDGKITTGTVITNYSYFFVDRLFLSVDSEPTDGRTFTPRNLFVFDEAHMFSDQFSNHCSVFFSEKRGQEYLEDIRHAQGDNSGMEQAYANSFRIIVENIARSTVGPANVSKFLSTLMKFYGAMHNMFENLARASASESDHDHYAGIQDKYRRLLCKVEDFFKYGFEVAVTCDEKEKSMSVKPIFPLGVFEVLSAKYNLFLSATLDPELMCQTLSLDRSTVSQVKAPYPFNDDDKIVRIPTAKQAVRLNYTTSKDPAVMDRLGRMTSAILKRHDGESGIVAATSFALCTAIADRIKGNTHRILLHRSGIGVDELVEELKRSAKEEPTLLLSPSLFEGIDLPGESSRFQVIVKAPYYSLGDKRITAIMRKYPDIYARMTVMRLVQALGRSTRFKGDRSISYFLDANLERLFVSDHNVWQEQFSVENEFEVV